MRFARLTALATLTLALLAAPLAVGAQSTKRMPRVAVVFEITPVTTLLGAEPSEPLMRLFLEALRTLGYVEGQNIVIERRSADGRYERLPEIVTELIQTNVDVIVSTGTPVTRVAKEATRAIPIVMTAARDPVAAGFVASLARPGGNITGSSGVGPELQGKVVEMLKEAVPRVTRLAALLDANRRDPAVETVVRAAADALRLTLLPAVVDRQDQLASAFATFTQQRANGLYVQPSALANEHRKPIADLAIQHRLPLISSNTEVARAGGLIGYGPRFPDYFRRAAVYVDKILKGANPGDLPVEQAAKFYLVINLKTAKALGLTIPPAVLSRADEIIQ
jgi:putative ABC transport system substrate-binding protein